MFWRRLWALSIQRRKFQGDSQLSLVLLFLRSPNTMIRQWTLSLNAGIAFLPANTAAELAPGREGGARSAWKVGGGLMGQKSSEATPALTAAAGRVRRTWPPLTGSAWQRCRWNLWVDTTKFVWGRLPMLSCGDKLLLFLDWDSRALGETAVNHARCPLHLCLVNSNC